MSALDLFSAVLIPLAVSLGVALLLVTTKRWHGSLTLDSDHGVQRMHEAPTPRVGGVAIFLGLLAARLFSDQPYSAMLGLVLLASAASFTFGLIEDLSKRVSARTRLLATLLSGFLAYWLTNVYLGRVEVWGLDALLTITPFAILFSAFAVAGVTNSVNQIDGFNGLASGTVIVTSITFAWVSYLVGDTQLMWIATTIAAATAGFFLVNFPWGKIFLGDGGAFLLGFLLAWLAMALPMRNPQVTPWASLLICAYPIIEILFSAYRRFARRSHKLRHPLRAAQVHAQKQGHALGVVTKWQPDRVHFHHLVHRKWAHLLIGKHASTVYKNSMTSVWCLALPVLCSVLVSFTYQSRLWSLLSVLLVLLIYVLLYRRLSVLSKGCAKACVAKQAPAAQNPAS